MTALPEPEWAFPTQSPEPTEEATLREQITRLEYENARLAREIVRVTRPFMDFVKTVHDLHGQQASAVVAHRYGAALEVRHFWELEELLARLQ